MMESAEEVKVAPKSIVSVAEEEPEDVEEEEESL